MRLTGSILSWPLSRRHCVGMLFLAFPLFTNHYYSATKTHDNEAVYMCVYVNQTLDNSL